MKSKKPITTDVMIKKYEKGNVEAVLEVLNKTPTISTKTSWITEIEEICSKEDILPSDLIECYKNRNKAVKVAKNDNKGAFMNVEDALSDNSGLSKMQLEMRKKKL